MNGRVLYVSPRLRLLRAVSLFAFLVAGAAIWAVTVPSKLEWAEGLGPDFWWMVPGALIALSLVLPAALAWLHGRYVLELVTDGERVHARLFLLWGSRTRTLAVDALAGARVTGSVETAAPAWRARLSAVGVDWLFDAHGQFPDGEAALLELFSATA